MTLEPATPVSHDSLILVGDGQKALFLRNRGNAQRVDLVVERIFEQDNPATRDQGTDRPGRSIASPDSRTAISWLRRDSGRGPAQIDPGFTKSSGPQYIAKRERDFGLHSHCRWIDGPVNVGAPQPKHPGQHGNKVKVCY